MEGGEVVEVTINKVSHHDETEVEMKTDALEDAIEVAEDIEDALDEVAEKWRKCKRYMFFTAVGCCCLLIILLIIFGTRLGPMEADGMYKGSKGVCTGDLGKVIKIYPRGKNVRFCSD